MKVLRNENPKRFAHAKLRKIGCPLRSNASSRAASTSLRGPSCFRSKGITTFAPNDTFLLDALALNPIESILVMTWLVAYAPLQRVLRRLRAECRLSWDRHWHRVYHKKRGRVRTPRAIREEASPAIRFVASKVEVIPTICARACTRPLTSREIFRCWRLCNAPCCSRRYTPFLLSPELDGKDKWWPIAWKRSLRASPARAPWGGALRQGVKRMHGLPLNHIEVNNIQRPENTHNNI